MNEEKLISILRYFGVSRCRPKVSTYKIAKVFGLQWKSAQRWARIMSSIPQENWSEARVKALHAKYVAIDAGGDPDEEANGASGASGAYGIADNKSGIADNKSGLADNKSGRAYDPIDAEDDVVSDELELAWGNNPNKESTELEYAPLDDGTTPRTAPSSESGIADMVLSKRRASGDQVSGIADKTLDADISIDEDGASDTDSVAYGYDPEGSLV